MALGMEIGLGSGHIVLNGDPALPKKGHILPNFRPMFIVAKQLDGSRCHLVRRALAQATLCYMGIQLPQKGHSSLQFWAHVYYGQEVIGPIGTMAVLDKNVRKLKGFVKRVGFTVLSKSE